MPPSDTPSSTAATSEEVRALITVLWELASKLDRVLNLFERHADPRDKPHDLYRPR